jgi:(E)-4-hydroxy-3-methylbut-2-enyl-diphosphate synthase
MKRCVVVGSLAIGGKAPIRVESMLKTPLSDGDSTFKEMNELVDAGCELVRVAFPDVSLKKNLAECVSRSQIPVMADIHFDHRLAIAAIEAGCAAIRTNPGNMDSRYIRTVVEIAKERGSTIRIGSNSGSVNRKQMEEAKGDKARALFLAVKEQADLLLSSGFDRIILSAKSTSVPITVRANALLAQAYPDLPFHVGITEAGPGMEGIVKGAVGLSLLLSQGIGDTIRVSLTGPSVEEVRVGYAILGALELRHKGIQIISCPLCGRRRVDVASLLSAIRPHLKGLPDGLKVAVMGCEVNGPREAQEADLGFAGSPHGIIAFSAGRVEAYIPLDKIDEELPKIVEEWKRRRGMSDE